MSEQELSVRARGLSKVYRLYQSPRHRVLDMLGLLRNKPGVFTEKSAVDGIDLEIRRGEKIAIIGRNGAGKSTLLKLVSGVITPTTGEIQVWSEARALLQIGTGFHPDFSGRENALAYLAQLGVAGVEAEERVTEIAAFAELEDYVDQPLKTYSSGMVARLMFATSTAIRPELLILDEVLSVGDAYFTQKSFERIHSLCEGGTTLLLVTHDLYSAMELCDRFIWLEKGRVLLDGDATRVVSRYEASIRDQQEERLRRLRLAAMKENEARRSETQLVFGQLRCVGNVPIDRELPVARIRICRGAETVASIAPGEESENATAVLWLESGEGNWGAARPVDGRAVRDFSPQGSIYHRAPFVVRSERVAELAQGGALEMEIEFQDTAETPLVVELLIPGPTGEGRVRGDLENKGSGQWLSRRVALRSAPQLEPPPARGGRYGNQRFSISDVRFLDREGREKHIFSVGEALRIQLGYRIADPEFRQHPVVQVNFLRDGVTRSHRFTLENALFDYAVRPEGVLEIVADPLLLGPGSYLVNVTAMREGGYDRNAQQTFFTANEDILDLHARGYEIRVEKTGNLLVDDTVFLHTATWVKDGDVVYRGTYPLDPASRRGE